MPDAQAIAYEITLVTPEQAEALRRRRMLRRVTIVGAVFGALIAPSPVSAVTRQSVRSACVHAASLLIW